MWRRLNREDLVGNNPLAHLETGRAHTFVWNVYEEYEPQYRGDDIYISAVETSAVKKSYEPLLETPHLFLDFARLDESKHRGDDAGEWIRKHGLLGLHRNEPQKDRDSGLLKDRDTRLLWSLGEYNDRGGPQESISDFNFEVFRANYALSLYEAALSADEDKLEAVLFPVGHTGEDLGRLYEWIAKESNGTHVEVLVDIATRHVGGVVQQVLNAFAYPCPTFRLSRFGGGSVFELQSPRSLTASLWPRNLLGAMYLQFYWLITSAGDLSRCKHCGRIISYAAPLPMSGDHESRKPRKDKEFCDSRCRQNYHYHNRIKPAREHRNG